MHEVKCCICKETAESPYNYIHHLDTGKSRIYEGHKRCLFLVKGKIEQGEEIEFTEIDTPKMKTK